MYLRLLIVLSFCFVPFSPAFGMDHEATQPTVQANQTKSDNASGSVIVASTSVVVAASGAAEPSIPLLDRPLNPSAQLINGIKPEIIAEIKSKPSRYAFLIDTGTTTSEPIIKASLLVVNSGGTLNWQINQYPYPHKFMAIVVDKVVVEESKNRDKIATININMKLDQPIKPTPNGKNGEDKSKLEDGSAGGNGADGENGADGYSMDGIPIYIIFNSVQTSSGNPASMPLFKFNFNGIDGGNGGQGGDGGNGGNGAKGVSAQCSLVGCGNQPGKGGNGGNAGKGGKGGNAGKGGKAPEVYVVVSRVSWNNALFIVNQEGGKPGKPGEPGNPGQPGIGGPAGNTCLYCGSEKSGEKGGEAASATPGDTTQVVGGTGNLFWTDYAGMNIFPQ